MAKRNKSDSRGFVFSTDPAFKFESEENIEQTLDPQKQKLLIRLDTKNRAGKAVTLVDGFVGKEIDLQELGKKLKSYCGTGGSVKEKEIVVQGDQRKKVLQWLIKNGYELSKLR